MTNEIEKTITDLVETVIKAKSALIAARTETAQARRRETEHLNFYNQTTKELDAAWQKLRASAPPDTDWSLTIASSHKPVIHK